MQHHKKVPPARLSQGLQPPKPPPQKNAPLSAAVESDVVGYTTITMEAGKWYLLGNPFVALDGATTYKINEMFGGSGFQDEDVLYILESSGKFIPFYWNASHAGWSRHPVLWREDTADYPVTSAVYLHKMSNGKLTFSGKVASIEIPVGTEEGNAWSLTSLVYPKSASLGEYTWEGFSNDDMLYTMSDNGVFTSHYWNELKQGWSLHPILWREDSTPLAIGQAVYLLKRSAGTGTISKIL